MSDLLRIRPVATPEMIAIFSDQATITHALAFEAALARAEADAGLIAGDAAEAIGAVCEALVVEPSALADEAALAGTLAIPLVRRLRAAVGGEVAASVHKGATSQDMADTVLMMQVRDGAALAVREARRIVSALRLLASAHANTPAIGRTLLQDALPVGFGLRLAQAAAGIADAADRLAAEVAANARVQFGGAAGTRAGLEGRGAGVAARLASDLGLAAGEPWHARRTGVAAIGCAVGLLIGAVAKFARDVSLLAQNAVGEAREPAIPGRGGSSAMAHKRNPTGCQVALAAAIRAPGLVSSLVAGLPQEQERGLGGWQAEGPALAELFLLASGSTAAMATVAEGLEIDEVAIARNLDAAGTNPDIGESAAIVAALLGERS